LSFSDFKEVNINNPGTSSFYGSDDLLEVMKILNGKIISNRQVKIKNPWQFQDNYDIVAASVIPANPGANTKRFYVDPADLHFKMKSSGGTVLDFDVLGAGAQGEANTASNIGTAGVGLWKQKVGVELQFKKINGGSNKITVTDDTGNNEVDIDIAEVNLLLQNLGGTLTVSKGGTGVSTFPANSLLKGNGTSALTNIAVGTNGQILTMVSGAPAWAAASASQDLKTAVFEGGIQVGTVGRSLNFSNADDFVITENAGADRFDISINRRWNLVAAWQNDIVGVAKTITTANTYEDWLASNGDGVSFNVDGMGMNEFMMCTSWWKNGGTGTQACQILHQTTTNVVAEITNNVDGKNTSTGTLPTFFQDTVRSVKVQLKSTISGENPVPRAVQLYYR
jgi:hypothetical protein